MKTLLPIRFLMNYIVMLILLMCSFRSSALEIENVKSGMFCQNSENIHHAYVCNDKERTYVMKYRKCIPNDNKIPCMSSGFEFDYKDMTEEAKITCKTTYKFSDDDLKKSEVSENKFNMFNESWTYEPKFKSRDGHYVFPVSTVMYYSLEPPYKRVEQTACFYHDNVIFEYQYEIVYPKEDK